jgi:hypothetical protein
MLAAGVSVAWAGCGQSRQDAHEPSGTFTVSVLHASFPRLQRLAQNTALRIVVQNTGTTTVPNLAVTVDSFSKPTTQPHVASAQRPVWIINRGPGPHASNVGQDAGARNPGGYVTAYTNTWAAGPVPPGQARSFVWRVTAVAPGIHRVTYTVAAGLNGKAHARLANGQIPQGHFIVFVVRAPAQSHVDPTTGRVVPGPPPAARP